jgi:type VI secretion system protein ImpM
MPGGAVNASKSTAPGWYGKLPTLGDFAQRRLDTEWVRAWDDWLAYGLQGLREDDAWLEHYLQAPAWRFALLPGALGDGGQTALSVGALVPSVDRVGRYFPLTVAATDLSPPQTLAEASALHEWAGRLEDCAVRSLYEDWTAEALDAALQGLSPPLPPAAEPSEPVGFAASISRLAAASVSEVWQGHSLWWRGSDPEPALRVPGMPQGRQFRALFHREVAT